MSSSAILKNSPLRHGFEFNWIFLIQLIVCGVLTLFFQFYFNRVLAAVLSYGIRIWTWHKYRIYFDVKSFQVSILAGRLFFKEFRYHGNNETILIQSGYVTWRYWLRNFKQLSVNRGNTPEATQQTPALRKDGEINYNGLRTGEIIEEEPSIPYELPCRLVVSVKGVEWFIYNRSLAYDAIALNLAQENPKTDHNTSNLEEDLNFSSDSQHKQDYTTNRVRDSSASETRGFEHPDKEKLKIPHQTNLSSSKSSSFQLKNRGNHITSQSEEKGPFALRILPIEIKCEKAAIVAGNHNSQSVLIVKIENAAGKIDASNSQSKLDMYRQLVKIHFEHPTVRIRPNNDYKEDQTTSGSRGHFDELKEDHQKQHICTSFRRHFQRGWQMARNIFPNFQESASSFSSALNQDGVGIETGPRSNSWQGLSRYLDENRQDSNYKWCSIEYARVSTILESLSAEMELYWDSAGIVRERNLPSEQNRESFNNINGDDSPEWGINVSFGAATVNYGPWADRQRADIQRIFFPSLCKDAIPAKNLVPGQLRVATEFKMNIEFDEKSVLRIPTKEASKNWKWSKLADNMSAEQTNQKKNTKNGRKMKSETGNHGPKSRPFGWLDLRFGAHSTIKYFSDIYAGSAGINSNLEIDLPTAEITTSVNHGLLWKSTQNRISCDLSQPLKWNGLRIWKFDIRSKDLELFILREHAFLLTDLIDDWTNGPPQDFFMFCPFKYHICLHLEDFRIFFNVNDSNIINNPSDMDDNTYIILSGVLFDANITLPLQNYRPHHNDLSFDIEMENIGFNLHVPPWNTQATFLDSNELGTLKNLNFKGKFQYCSVISSSNTDTFLIDIICHSLSANIFGFAIRLLLKIKDNYFGEDFHFKTLEEYQKSLNVQGKPQNLPKPPHMSSNDLDIIMSIYADHCNLNLPSNLYSAINSICIEIKDVTTDLRFNNYFMDYELEFSTISLSQSSESHTHTPPTNNNTNIQLLIDGLSLFENRLFGLPPTEPTYICNRDFSVGAITGECTTEFLRQLICGSNAFLFSLDDVENALPSSPEPSHEITFLRASLESFHVWLHVDNSAFFLSTEKISINFNDWAGPFYSKKLKISIPGLKFGCVDIDSAPRQNTSAKNPVKTDALIQSAISIVMIEKNPNFEGDRQLQQEHIQRHDQRTHRCNFLFHENLPYMSIATSIKPPTIKPPQMPVPVFSGDSLSDQIKFESRSPSTSFHAGRKSSFLSLKNSIAESLGPENLFGNHSKESDPGVVLTYSRSRKYHSPNKKSPFYESLILSYPETESSSFQKVANFPLEGIEPDISDLPGIYIDSKEKLFVSDNQMEPQNHRSGASEKKGLHKSYMISFTDPIRGFLNHQAINAAIELLTSIQAASPSDILDELQIDSLKEVIDDTKDKLLDGTTLDLRLRISSLSLRFLNPTTISSKDIESYDQFDLSISGLSVTFRSENTMAFTEANGKIEKSFVFIMKISSATFAAKEKSPEMSDIPATISCFLDELTSCVNSGEETIARIKIKGFELVTPSCKFGHVTSLLSRTKFVSNEILKKISALSKQPKSRILLFTYLVATAGQQRTEPLFLTRPSYVLRSATGHLRTQVSWIIISRLHHAYNCLDPLTQCDIASRSLKISENLPKEAKKIILEILARWRSWDSSNMDNCVIMSKIFGPRQNSVWNSFEIHSFRLLLEVKLCRLVVDPGPKQNALSIFQLSVNFVKMVSPSCLKSSIQANNHVPLLTIEVLLEDFSIFLNWELYEMTREIFKISDQSRCSQETLITKKSNDNLEISETKLCSNLHFIFAIHKTSIQVDTINLMLATFMNEMKASYLVTYDEKVSGQRISSFIIIARTATSSVKSHSQELGLVQLRSPSLYVSYHEEDGSNMSEKVLRTAANCHKLDFIIRQDIAALMEVLNLLVVDEMAQIYELISIKSHCSSANLESNTGLNDMNLIPEVSIALFLDRYHISLQLLQSLTYDVFGNVARASFASQLNRQTIFDFDVKDHTHEMTTSNGQDGISSISLLTMPSTNGRVTLLMAGKDAALSILASIEPIILDAAVFHTILTTINRPEVLDMIENVRNDAENIKFQLYHIFYGKSPGDVSNSTQKKPLFYDAHLTLAGFGIVAEALTTDKSQKTAKLDLNLGCIQLVAMSSDDNRSSIDKYPQLCISLQKVMIELTRCDINKSLEPCGGLSFAAFLKISSKTDSNGNRFRNFHFKGSHLKINLYSKTASTVIDVLGHLQDKIKNIDLSRENNYLQKLRKAKPQIIVETRESDRNDRISTSKILFESIYSLELLNVQVSWLVGEYGKHLPLGAESEDLVLSLRRMNFSSRKQDSAQLIIEDLQLQMVPNLKNKTVRSLNSALLPKVMFDVKHDSTENSRRLAFQAGGKLLEIRLTPRFMIPASALKNSIVSATEEFRQASNNWKLLSGSHRQQPFLGKKHLESLLIDADFAGAVVHISGKGSNNFHDTAWSKSDASQERKFGKFANNDPKSTSSITVLRSPRLACKIEYKDRGADDLSLNAEVKVDASSNIIYPSVVPIIMEISSIVKEIVSEEEIRESETKLESQKSTNTGETNLLNTKPITVLDRTKLNLGLRICRQEFGLSCQPIARVAATTQFEDIYIAINTVQHSENDQFFAASAKITEFKASVQHVYSREATGSFDIESVILSLMNSKHVGSTNGIAAILKISPVKVQLNAKQLHNFLLFREIWMPQEIRQRPETPPPHFSSLQSHNILVQRYQQVAATSAFPWNATVLISGLEMQLDLGQAIGKSAFTISRIWFSSKKNSAWEQSVCLGIEEVTVQSTGRLSGRFTLLDFKLRTSIQWPARKLPKDQTPLVQGSIVFKRLSLKAAFDYYAFLISEIESLHFLMYNACSEIGATDDQLMAILEAEAVQIFCTTTSSSHVLALYQAVQKLIQEKRINFATSLLEIENILNRTSTISTNSPQKSKTNIENEIKTVDSPISLHTNVIVMMRAVNIGIFPTTFLDHQVFKLEALNIKSRFGVTMDDGKIHSILGLNLGQLRIGLAGVKSSEIPKSLGDISVEDVVKSVVGSRGGTILKVPMVQSTMQTWQVPKSNRIEYIFKSSFGGKVEVGWNYSRISYIRGMWATHSKALAQRLGKPLPLSAVRITGVPDGDQQHQKDGEQRKITAEVNVPLSRYNYTALEPSIIETPQLRDMGEATPPLEWIGLHRDRLPNLTHQIVIVTLLEFVAQIEDAYVKILGSP